MSESEKSRAWIAVEIALGRLSEDDPRFEALSVALFELGAGGLEVKNVGEALAVVASFPADAAPDEPGLVALFELLELEPETVAISDYAEVDWATHWRQHFHPIAFGSGKKRVDIVPSWLEPPIDAGHVLRIDPSSAFGTGLHATTAMCIESVIDLSPVTSILDIGTGTGIIALAAIVLGAKRALGTDIDPEALRVSKENAERNGLGDRLALSMDEPSRLGEKFNVVAANILAQPLIQLAPEIARVCAERGHVILSGITHSQADDVVMAYEREGFIKIGVLQRDEWARVLLRTP